MGVVRGAAGVASLRTIIRIPAFFDEMFDPDGVPREHCRELWSALKDTAPGDMTQMQERAERSFLHEGITFLRLRGRKCSGAHHPDRHHPPAGQRRRLGLP